jgi:SfnB family sulfur acquisition oxidoreductase
MTVTNLEQGTHIISNDAEAIALAKQFSREIAATAAVRDQQRQLPVNEINRFSATGLWGITIPQAYGGAEVSHATLAQVIAIVAAADPSIAQIPQSHFYSVEALRLVANDTQKQFFFGQILEGQRFGNAATESKSKSSSQVLTKITPVEGGYVINGQKFYSTGALLAHWIPVVATDPDDRKLMAFVERDSLGLKIIDDWSSFGQRTTASGTTVLDNVRVKAEYVIPNYQAYDQPTSLGAFAQIIQAAIDLGIAQAALVDTLDFVRQYSRPWIDSGLEAATQDPLLLADIGHLQIQLHAAEALLWRAGEFLDISRQNPNDQTVADASIAVAEAKVLTTEIALQTSNKLFELAGTKSTLQEFGLDRHWRNARTHTLHDPVRWKYHIIGNYTLNHLPPPRHPYI